LINSNARKADQAALVAKPKGMVALTRISRMEQIPAVPKRKGSGRRLPVASGY
jgi:hypothetical protein